MARQTIETSLGRLFDAERSVRQLHEELVDQPREELLEVVEEAIRGAFAEPREEEASLRLVRIAAILGEIEGPRAVDALVDVLASEHPEARLAAGAQLQDTAFERFKEVALGVERALKRLPVGSPALPELPYVLSEVPEPGVIKLLGRFLQHQDPDAVAAAIEVMADVGDPSSAKLLEDLLEDTRTVEVGGEDEETEQVTIGDLAAEALEMLAGPAGDGDGDGDGGGEIKPTTLRRGGAE